MNKIFFVVFSGAILFTSCKKHGCTDEFAVNYDSQAEKSLDHNCIYQAPDYEDKLYLPDFGANTATLMVDKAGLDSVYTKFGYLKNSNYYLRSIFKDGNNDIVSAGVVEVRRYVYMNLMEYVAIEEQDDGVYSSYVGLSQSNVNVYLPDTMTWRAQGAGWPVFILENPIESLPKISSVLSGVPSVSTYYNFQVSLVNDADSLSLAIHGQRGSLVKIIPADQTEAIFTKEEMEKIGKGDAVLRVMAMEYRKVDDGGRSYYFVNASRSSKTVRIQP